MKKGGTHSEETKKRMSMARSGVRHWAYGKKLSVEHVEKLKESHLGQTPWNKGTAKPKVLKGRPFGDRNPRWNGGQKKCLDCTGLIASRARAVLRCVPCAAKARSGPNSAVWIMDRTKLVTNEKKHLDVRYKEWACTVKNRDSWKCRIANEDCRGRMEAHHILRWKDYVELRYEVNNGITLCSFHHPRKRSEETRLSPYFSSLVLNET